MDWLLLLLLIPVGLAAGAFSRRLSRRMQNPPVRDTPFAYAVEAVNRTGRRVFVTCIDGGSRRTQDLPAGAEAVILDSRTLTMMRPSWRLVVLPAYNRPNGLSVYRELLGSGLRLEVVRPERPALQHIRITFLPDRPVVEGPARRAPAGAW